MDKLTKLQLMEITGWTEPTALKFMKKHGVKVPTIRNSRWEVDAVKVLPVIKADIDSANNRFNALSNIVDGAGIIQMANSIRAQAIDFGVFCESQEEDA